MNTIHFPGANECNNVTLFLVTWSWDCNYDWHCALCSGAPDNCHITVTIWQHVVDGLTTYVLGILAGFSLLLVWWAALSLPIEVTNVNWGHLMSMESGVEWGHYEESLFVPIKSLPHLLWLPPPQAFGFLSTTQDVHHLLSPIDEAFGEQWREEDKPQQEQQQQFWDEDNKPRIILLEEALETQEYNHLTALIPSTPKPVDKDDESVQTAAWQH